MRRILWVSAAVLLVACSSTGPSTSSTHGTSTSTTDTTIPVATEYEVVAYLVATPAVGAAGPYLVPVRRTWVGERAEECAVEALLAGYTFGEVDLGLGSAVPAETKLLGLSVDPPTATVDVSRAFESGGGTASMHARLGQLVYTLTQFRDGVEQVTLEMDGDPVTVFSGEGIDVSEPLTRSAFDDLLAPVHVEYPPWEETIEFPMTMRGTAAQSSEGFRVTIVDWDGLILYERAVPVPGSATQRQPFEIDIFVDLSDVLADGSRQYDGAVIVAGLDENDQETILEIPVRFAELR